MINYYLKHKGVVFCFLVTSIFVLFLSRAVFAESIKNQTDKIDKTDKTEKKLTYQFDSIKNYPINGSDPLFENLLIEFSKYSTNYKLAFERFYQIAIEQKSLDYAQLAFKKATLSKDKQALALAGKLWLSLAKNNQDKLKYFFTSIVISMNQGNIKKAKESLVNIMKTSKNKNQIFKELIIAFNQIFKQNSNNQYLDLINLAVDSLKKNEKASAYEKSSKLALFWKNKKYAVTFSKKALEVEPHNEKLMMYHLSLLASNKEYLQLVKFFDKNIAEIQYPKINQEISSIYLVTALNNRIYGKNFVSLAEYLIKKKQNTPLGSYVLALYSIEFNNLKKAKSLLERVVSIKSQVKQSSLFNLGLVYALLSDFDKSIVSYSKVTDPQYKAQAQFFSNLILATQMADKNALTELRNYQKKDSKKFIANISQFSKAYRKYNKLQLASQYLSFILTKFKDDETQLKIGINQSMVLYQLGDFKGFENLTSRLLLKFKDNAFLLNTVGYYLLDKKNEINLAEPYIVKAYELNKNDSAILDSLGWLYFKKNNYKIAFSLVSKAYAMSPDLEILAHLIEVMFYLDKPKQAKSLLVQALAKNPQDGYLLELKKRLFPGLLIR